MNARFFRSKGKHARRIWRSLTSGGFKRAVGSSLVCLVLLFPLPLKAGQTLEDVLSMDLVVHFIDVGVGDAIFIQLPDPAHTHEVLIDGGDRRRGYNFLDYLGRYLDDPINLAIITHSDYDHWSGIERLLSEDHHIAELWDPGYDRACKFKGPDAAAKKK